VANSWSDRFVSSECVSDNHADCYHVHGRANYLCMSREDVRAVIIEQYERHGIPVPPQPLLDYRPICIVSGTRKRALGFAPR
jgi:hypothetical protein